MTEAGLRAAAVYNPALWSSEELKRYFVARQDVLDRIIGDLRRERPGSPPKHRLILGQRGMGKTTLLRRIALAVLEDPELCVQWLPLTFPEEQYNVAKPADLWLNCLDALSDFFESTGRTGEADELDRMIEAVRKDRAEAVLKLLVQIAKHHKKRLLLLLDNVDLVLDRLKDDHWDLRETMQSEPRLLFMGASARAIEATYEYGAAFYDFFKVDELGRLTQEETFDILRRLAEVERSAKVLKLLDQDRARIKTLHTLTGGNPRTIVLLFKVLAGGLDGDVRSDLEGLLDLVTPLYKARFEELPDLSQQVVDAVALHWDPVSARILADSLGMKVNKVSAQLSRLEEAGIIEKVKPAKGKRAAFQIAERFFNIWYLMRASRRVRRKLIWLVQFLKMFFSEEELQEHARRKFEEGSFSDLRSAEYALALAQAVESPAVRSALENQALEILFKLEIADIEIDGLLDLRGEDNELSTKASRLRDLQKIRDLLIEPLRESDVNVERFLKRITGSGIIPRSSKLNFSEMVVGGQVDDIREWEKILESEWDIWTRNFGQFAKYLYRAIGSGDMENLLDTVGAKAAAERYRIPEIAELPWCIRIVIDPELGEKELKLAERACRRLIEIDPNICGLWLLLGDALTRDGEKYEEAEAAYRRAAMVDPNNARPWSKLAGLFASFLGRYVDASEASQRATEIDPNTPETWSVRGDILMDHLKKYEEAESAYRKAISIDPDHYSSWQNLAHLLARFLKKYNEAEIAFRKSTELRPKVPSNWIYLGILLEGQKTPAAEAVTSYRKAIELDPNNLVPVCFIASLLIRLDRWVEASGYIRELIANLTEEMEENLWPVVLDVYSEAIDRGKMGEILKITDETETHERWRPLREALGAIDVGSIDFLNGVAPEIRDPALKIVERISPKLLDSANE